MGVDNSALESKIQLREHAIRMYHSDGPFRVFDACQGRRVIWNGIRRRNPDISFSYYGADRRSEVKPDILVDDSTRIIQAGLSVDILDIDVYGHPWNHLKAFCGTMKPGAATVFLTFGNKGFSRMNKHASGYEILNLPKSTPGTLAAKVSLDLSLDLWLNYPARCGIIVGDIYESVGASDKARYFSIRLTKNAQKDS